jgi:hypothetical protein
MKNNRQNLNCQVLWFPQKYNFICLKKDSVSQMEVTQMYIFLGFYFCAYVETCNFAAEF